MKYDLPRECSPEKVFFKMTITDVSTTLAEVTFRVQLTSVTSNDQGPLTRAWLALTSVKYHGNLKVLIPLNQRLALAQPRVVIYDGIVYTGLTLKMTSTQIVEKCQSMSS